MRIYSKIVAVFIVFSLFLISCNKKEIFRIDLTRSLTEEVKRSMTNKTLIKISIPDENGEMKENVIRTENKLDIVTESSEQLKDPSKPGVFQSTEKLQSVVYSISQKQKDQAEKFVVMEYKNGKIEVLDKKIPEEESGNQPGFEAMSRQALRAMAESSDVATEITLNDRGEIINVVSDEATEKGMSESMEVFSGSKGIVFPEKAIKVGDTWIEKKEVSDFAGFVVTGDPIDLQLKFSREEDEILNGKKVAVFLVDYRIEKKGVKGSFGGFPITANIKDLKKIRMYFDKDRKVFIKNITDSNILILSDPSVDVYSGKKLKIDINVENKVHSVTTEKVN